MKISVHFHLNIALVLATGATGVASAADHATVADSPLMSGVIIESETAPAAKRQPLLPSTPFAREAAEEDLRRRITRVDRPDGSTFFYYNDDAMLEHVMATRGEDGETHIGCGGVHSHSATTAEATADDR